MLIQSIASRACRCVKIPRPRRAKRTRRRPFMPLNLYAIKATPEYPILLVRCVFPLLQVVSENFRHATAYLRLSKSMLTRRYRAYTE